MNKYFDDSSITIHYIQQMLNETYNSKVHVNGEYYKHFDMNYGFAHYIAKYLDYKYPLLDKQSVEDYSNITTNSKRDLTKPISIMNYFLCDNVGNKLQYNPHFPYTDETTNVIYKKIYNQYMIVVERDNGSIGPSTSEKYMIKNDLPLFTFYNNETEQYTVNNNIIFNLDTWNISKKVCEIDNFVASYLLGRTITPFSSMEDIYYAQRLLIRDRNITREEKGIWCVPGQDGTEFDLTTTIINYQSQRVNTVSSTPLFVTGYFDIFTEAYARKELGVDSNDVYGL